MKLLSILIGAFLLQATDAARFHKDCLELDATPVGNENVNDRSITNDIQLITKKFNSKMRVYSAKTCVDK